jgi:pimeloyl-ACP methyl ester carboxylesterase
MKNLPVALIIPALTLLSCTSEPEVSGPTEPIGVFVEGPCPIPVPEGLVEGESVKCGTVTVPEFHSAPNDKTLLLRVAVFPSVGESPSPSPLFVATAGPGASGIESVTPEVAGPLGPALLANRDLVLIDYRGLPLAEPNLMCPEITDASFQALGEALSGEEFMAGQLIEAAACRDRLRGEGVTLEAFNNTETAADIAMVMTALGYETFNVYGTSAGTILAQHLLRDFPDRLRSVVIDSTVPAGRGNVHIEAPTIVGDTLDAVVGLCQTDSACSAAYPDLRQEAKDLIGRYNREPVTLEVTNPMTGEPMPLALTGHRVAQAILMLNSQTPTVPLMPWFIHQLAIGNTGIVNDFLWTIAPPAGNFSWALGTTIFCMEFSDFTEEDILFPGLYPEYEGAVATQAFGGRTIARTCEMWGVERAGSSLKQPVSSDVPVLLMAGKFDSLTPPSWAEEVASTLNNAYLFEIPGYAHSPTFAGECPATMALQFFADPTQAPDGSCLESMQLEFVVQE